MLASPLATQLAWARSIQDPVRHTVAEPWNGAAQIARPHTGVSGDSGGIRRRHPPRGPAVSARRFGVTTERALALMFDIRVQNGSISAATEAPIRADFAAIPAAATPDGRRNRQTAFHRQPPRRSLEPAAYVEDVRARKLTIANGAGTVHGVAYDLERQFGIGLTPLAAD